MRGGGDDSSFYDSSWELRRGLEVAELADVPAEWRDVGAGHEPVRNQQNKRTA